MAILDERDLKQRSIGCIGFSLIAHAGLMGVLMLSPQKPAQDPGGQNGNGEVAYLNVEGDPGSGASAPTQPNGSPNEMMVASANDPSAVALPEKPPEVPERPEKKPEKQIVAPAPTPAPAPPPPPPQELPAKKAVQPKPLPKKAVAKKAAPAKAAVVAAENGDVETKAEEQLSDEEKDQSFMPLPEKNSAEQGEQVEEAPQPIVATHESTSSQAEPAKEKEAAPVSAPAPAPAPTAAPVAAPAPVASATPVKAAAASSVPAAASSTAGTSSGSTMSANAQGEGQGAAAQGKGANALGQGVGAVAGAPSGPIRDESKLVPRPGNKQFKYPYQERFSNKPGEVRTATVIGRVTQDGSVVDVYVEKSSGSKAMDKEALETFRLWKYMPGQEGLVRKPVNFVLAGEAQEAKATLGRDKAVKPQ